MTQFVKKYWRELLLLLLLGILIFLISVIFKGRALEKELISKNEQNNREVQRLTKRLEKEHARFALDSAEKMEMIHQYDTLITEITQELTEKEGSVRTYLARIKRMQGAATDAKVASDTTEYVRRMDSAAAEIAQLSILYTDLLVSYDQLVTTYAAKDSTQKAFIDALTNQLDATRNAFLDLMEKYNILYKDFETVAKKAKNRQLLNKILAGATLATGGILLLK